MDAYQKRLFMLLFGTKKDIGRTKNNILYAINSLNKSVKDAFIFVAEPLCALFEHKGVENKTICRELYNEISEQVGKLVK